VRNDPGTRHRCEHLPRDLQHLADEEHRQHQGHKEQEATSDGHLQGMRAWSSSLLLRHGRLQAWSPPRVTTAVPCRPSLASAVSRSRLYAHRRSPPAAPLVARRDGAPMWPRASFFKKVLWTTIITLTMTEGAVVIACAPRRRRRHSQRGQGEPGALCSPWFPIRKEAPSGLYRPVCEKV
jgi:hypothetical protein